MFSSGLINNPAPEDVVTHRISYTSSTLGSEYFIANKEVLPLGHFITAILAYVAVGTPTVSVGSTAGGKDIASTIKLAAGWNNVSMISPESTTLKLSLTSDSAEDIKWNIFYSDIL
ncbi:MAG: hypothetical protein LLG40_06715 [Deltaproteobacteria bacterium]|nr:hypothetical protein [Deltaproteobacteria bacterium]